MQLHVTIFKGDQHPAFADAAMIRETVFMHEQHFTIELDALDAAAWHGVVYDEKNTPIAVGRLFPDENGVWHIGRIAVMQCARKHGVGSYLMLALEQFAADKNVTEITLSAQIQAVPFYRTLGYAPYGEPFYDEYCEHIQMKKQL